jgi:DNA gyrase subunit A
MKGREEHFPTVDLRTAAEERYLAYALSVITMRALPDVRDGLKPVQRRILYAMYQNLRLTAGTKARKSAAVVGEVLGKYHPHGDVAAYEAMVRMAQDFALRYPLVHGEGNFGSLDGDNPAAMRYTEARLAAIAEELLRDIRNDTVDFRDNYDATLREPVVLPAAIPQLLINGSTGIAVGMATNIPPHNLREVGAALLALIDDPDLPVKELCKHVKGPDFPTGGEILNTRAELRAIYETGQGAVRIRGEYNRKPERIGRKVCIVITSIPYTANKASIVEEIAEHIIARRLPQAVDVRDESTDVVRIVIEIKPDAPPDQVMAYLFKHTGLQINFNVNLTALTPSTTGVGQPARLNLKELCRFFLDFRLTVVTRRLEHELRELQARLHILAGFLKLFAGLDRAIKIIRESGSRADAQKALMKAFDLDEIQTDAVLETRLYQLARLEIEKIRQEQREKKERATEIERLLKSTKARWKIVSSELTQVVEKYGDARRTVLSAGAELLYDAEAYVVHEDATVVVTRDGWMKRVGEIKDPSSTRVREGDAAKWILRGNTRDQIVLVSNFGVAYVMKAVSVPATTGYGEPVQSLLNLKDGERIIHAVLLAAPGESVEPATAAPKPAPVQKELFGGRAAASAETPPATGPRWLIASAGGMGFFCRPDLSETTRSGRRIGRVKEGDEIVVASLAEGNTITAATKDGKILTFPADELPELAGAGRGVILMRLDNDDRLLGAVCHRHDTPPVAVDEDGTEHRFNLPEPAHRAQKGRKVIKRFKLSELAKRE